MNVNVYLPLELGLAAKKHKLPLSQLLQEAVTAEVKRLEAADRASRSRLRRYFLAASLPE